MTRRAPLAGNAAGLFISPHIAGRPKQGGANSPAHLIDLHSPIVVAGIDGVNIIIVPIV